MSEPADEKEKAWEEVPIGTRTSLEHEAWPGYRAPFYFTVGVGVVYLVLALLGLLIR